MKFFEKMALPGILLLMLVFLIGCPVADELTMRQTLMMSGSFALGMVLTPLLHRWKHRRQAQKKPKSTEERRG